MAHFALIDENSRVTWVVCVANDATEDETGDEVEAIGAAYCREHVRDGNWVQTSYNGRIRRRYAGIGMTYDADLDVFLYPKPHPSWVLDLDDSNDWVAPIPQPTEPCKNGVWTWNEEQGNWECHQLTDAQP